MKKKISIGLAVLLAITAILAGAYFYFKRMEDNWQTNLSKKIESYAEVVSDSSSSFKSVDKANDWLISWAESKDVSYTKYGNNVLIMTRKAGEGHEEEPSTILFCRYDTKYPSGSVQSIATAMAILKTNIEFGELKIIFVGDTDREFSGISHIPSDEIPDGATVFNLGSGNKHMYSLTSGGSKAYTISKSISYEETGKDVAIKISITGAPGGVPDTKISSYPNPVVAIGKFMAKMQSDAINFELASFKGGDSSGIYPSDAEAVIVINKDDVDRITGKLDSLKDDFKEKYEEDFPDAHLVYEQLQESPQTVINKNDSSRLLSLIYTMLNGIYYKDENGEVICISSINMVDTTDENMLIKLSISSLSSAKMAEIDQAINTLAGLSEFTVKITAETPIWSNSKGSDFAQKIKDDYLSYTSDRLEFIDSVPSTSCAILSKKFKKANIISITSTENSADEDGGVIMTYLLDTAK
ncbi:MAG: hypothetical protein PUG43_00975 [Clostridiales bacterium]|nr:hypothetical protein [Clostridiales bacterium]MDY4060594.1 hypothetical protein [Anaerovoracaceae bacterium]